MKQTVYNLIILDESGSMSGITPQTISGCNETINTIKASQETNAETQNQKISIFVFQSNPSNPSHYIVKNCPASDVNHITEKDYQPWGGTPLYDAIGSTLTDLRATVDKDTFAVGCVTIITDGMENASRLYSHERVVRMIDELKEMGWNFSFIGANIEASRTSASLHIDHSLQFEQNEEGTKHMFDQECRSRRGWNERIKMAFSKAMAEDDAICDEDANAESCERSKRNLFSHLRGASDTDYFSE